MAFSACAKASSASGRRSSPQSAVPNISKVRASPGRSAAAVAQARLASSSRPSSNSAWPTEASVGELGIERERTIEIGQRLETLAEDRLDPREIDERDEVARFCLHSQLKNAQGLVEASCAKMRTPR